MADTAKIPKRIRPRIVLILALTTLAAIGAMFLGASRLFQAQAISVASSQNALYLRSLNEALKQHQHLPFVIGENPLVVDLVARGQGAQLNDTLARFAEASQLEAIYIMALDGEVVASSNHLKENSFLGQNYGFRPYFQQAAAGKRSDYFAIGATTGRPGYFVAEPLTQSAENTVGVVAIKLDISELQASWEDRGEAVLATNRDGIVVMSSNPAWLYHALSDLDPARLSDIAATRQFGSKEIVPLDWKQSSESRIVLDGQTYLITSGPTEIVDWTVHFLTSAAIVQRQTVLATSILGAFIIGLVAFSVFLRSRRIQVALDVSQVQRRALQDTNRRLVAVQEELERSSKLAALGQLAASVTHELGQPISALKSHLFAAEIGGEITSTETLLNLRRLADRMEGITKQLRFFARQSGDEWTKADMVSVIGEALELVRYDLEAIHAQVQWKAPADNPIVEGNQLQLEQAVVNLLRNAEQAIRHVRTPKIIISCAQTEEVVLVCVSDNGAGLQGEALSKLEEPFYSTRSSGEGMGLGLAITAEIVRAHGGQIMAEDAPNGGATFKLSFPRKDQTP